MDNSLTGAAASEKYRFVTHLSKSKQFDIALMAPEQLALEVLMERSAFVARQQSTRELERPRGSPHDAIQVLEFGGPSKPCLDILSRPPGVLWASIVECCALLGNVGEVE